MKALDVHPLPWRPFAAKGRPVLRTLLMAVPLVLALHGCSEGNKAAAPGAAAPPPGVVVSRAAMKDFTRENIYTGRIEAIDKVGVRARVQGFLKKQNFANGAEVKNGQVLFEIEQEPFLVTMRSAQANLASAEAGLTLAQKTFERMDSLSRRGAATEASLDDAKSALLQGEATVKARRADLEKAELDMGYTRIFAPLDGRAGRAAYSVGELVGPSSDPLVSIVAQDPMYVTFPVPQKRLLEVRRNDNEHDGTYVELRLSDGSTYPQQGTILFSDIEATSGTDSVIVRATIANPERLLVDKQLVQVAVVRKKPEPHLVISQAALLLDQQGAYVYVVGQEEKIEIRRITPGQQYGALTEVRAGLSEGERVVVSGHQKVQPGKPVTAVEAVEGGATSNGAGSVNGKPGAGGK